MATEHKTLAQRKAFFESQQMPVVQQNAGDLDYVWRLQRERVRIDMLASLSREHPCVAELMAENAALKEAAHHKEPKKHAEPEKQRRGA